MRIDKLDVVLDASETPFYAGHLVQGHIELHASRKVRVGALHVRFSGTAETGWRHNKSKVLFESRTSVLDEVIDLTTTIADHCTDSFRLHEGQHCIPFEMKLPFDVISSVEKENVGSVRYMCTVVLDLPENGGTQLVAEKDFKVFSLLNLDAPHLRASASATEEDEVRGWCGLRGGVVEATMRVAETGLLPGETTTITLTMQHPHSRRKRSAWWRRREKHECVLISLCQQMDFVSSCRDDPTLFDRKTFTMAVESHGTCKGQPGKGAQTKELEFCVPPSLPPTSVQGDGLITISYFFKLDLDHFDVVVPVVIGSLKSGASFSA